MRTFLYLALAGFGLYLLYRWAVGRGLVAPVTLGAASLPAGAGDAAAAQGSSAYPYDPAYDSAMDASAQPAPSDGSGTSTASTEPSGGADPNAGGGGSINRSLAGPTSGLFKQLTSGLSSATRTMSNYTAPRVFAAANFTGLAAPRLAPPLVTAGSPAAGVTPTDHAASLPGLGAMFTRGAVGGPAPPPPPAAPAAPEIRPISLGTRITPTSPPLARVTSAANLTTLFRRK